MAEHSCQANDDDPTTSTDSTTPKIEEPPKIEERTSPIPQHSERGKTARSDCILFLIHVDVLLQNKYFRVWVSPEVQYQCIV
jgi:hypothetical protein